MTPARARGPRRDALARTMISLGLGAEAQAVLRAAASDDPAQADGAENGALASIAALLAHRPSEATGLDNDKLSEADDVALWRAVRQAEQHEGSAAAAAALAVTWPLLLGYPAEIRDRVLPLVAETMAAGGETEAAAAMLEARKDDPTLDMARGMLREANGRCDRCAGDLRSAGAIAGSAGACARRRSGGGGAARQRRDRCA